MPAQSGTQASLGLSAQSNALQFMQKLAIRLMSWCRLQDSKYNCRIDDLYSRREQLTLKYFNLSVMNIESCLHYLLQEKLDLDIINKLRKSI